MGHTAKVFSTIVPHCDAQELRHSRQQVMATFRTPGTDVVMAVDHRGIPRAPKLDATLDHSHATWRLHVFPAHGGPPSTPSQAAGG